MTPALVAAATAAPLLRPEPRGAPSRCSRHHLLTVRLTALQHRTKEHRTPERVQLLPPDFVVERTSRGPPFSTAGARSRRCRQAVRCSFAFGDILVRTLYRACGWCVVHVTAYVNLGPLIRHMHAIPPSNERASGRGGSTKHTLPNKSNEPASLMHHAWRSCSRARGGSLVAPRGQYHPQNWCFSSTRLTSTA